MTRPTHTIIPQRHGARGWQLCAPHQAQAWAIVSIKEAKIVGRYESKGQAKARLAQLCRPTIAKPSIGGRMPSPRPSAVVAQSLTRAEYDQLVLKGTI